MADLVDEIRTLLKRREDELSAQLVQLRHWRTQVVNNGRPTSRPPQVSLTVAPKALPAPQRKMSDAARARASKRMKARWRAAKAAGKTL